jgi:hypothetical protein
MTLERLAEILEKHKLWLNGKDSDEYADLSGTNFRDVDLSYVDLRYANLSDADLRYANLSDADLRYANLIGANLSGAKGLLSAVNFMETNFERTAEGYLAYKTFGGQYQAPLGWKIEKGAVISENVNACRVDICGSGINVAPLDWVKSRYRGEIWKVLIRWQWQSGVCVPYNTDGKIRCERVELIEKVER